MTSLTTEELNTLTKSVNERLAEFGPDTLGSLSVGVVRLVAEVFVEWQSDTERTFYEALNRPPTYIIRGEGVAMAYGPQASGPTPEGIIGAHHDPHLVEPDEEVDDDLDNVAVPHTRKRHARIGRNGNVQPTLSELIAEVRRMSMGTGDMPTMGTFDTARPGNWATSHAQTNRLGMTWNDLAEMAALRPRTRGGQPVGEERNGVN